MSVLKEDNNQNNSSFESEVMYPSNKEGVNNYAWQPSRKLAHHSSEDEGNESEEEKI